MKTTIIDGRKVIYLNNKHTTPPKQIIKQVYDHLPKDKVPIVFMTRRQYLEQYVKNQEKATGSKFTPQEKKQYIQQEMPVYRNIISRYTTNHNPYFPPAVVFFNDKKINDFKRDAEHEYGHEYAEKHHIRTANEEQFADHWRQLKNKKQVQQVQSRPRNPVNRILGW